MRKFTILLLIVALLVCLAACGKTPVTNTDDPTQASTTPTEPTEPTDPTDPIDQMVEEMQELFTYSGKYNYYYFALLSEYESPADVYLYNLFAFGFKQESTRPTQQERAFLEPWMGDDFRDVRRLPVERMDATLTELFGITLDQTTLGGLERMRYFEDTDCYYGYDSTVTLQSINVQQVEELDDGTIRVHYLRGNETYQAMVVTLKRVGDSYQIISNLYEDPRVGQMQALLEWKSENRFYNGALTSVYGDPADVDLFYLFYGGFKDESQEPTEQETELLEGKLGQHWKEMDLIRLPVEKIDAVLTDLFGITLEQTNGVGLENLVYLEETDCYYHCITGAHYADLTVVYVRSEYEGYFLVHYSTPYNGNFAVKLMPREDGSYQILSNTKVTYIYNQSGVKEAVSDYFEQREAYLMGISAEIPIANSGILNDEASHAAAINSADVGWLGSEVTIQVNGCWDSHAEAIATETVKFNVNGAEQTETVEHTIHVFLSSDGEVIISSDGYREITTGFTSASYLPPELQ